MAYIITYRIFLSVIYMKKRKCPLCGSEAELTFARYPGYQKELFYDIYECPLCKSSFIQPMAVDERIYRLIYKNVAVIPGYSRYYRYFIEIPAESSPLDYLCRQEESYWAVATYLRRKRISRRDMHILEIGCGMGYFTYALRRDGFVATGIDINQEAVESARNRFGDFYQCADLDTHAKSCGCKYDTLIMNQLIEHVPDVKALLATALGLLKDEGELVLTTPNKSLFKGKVWETDLPPVHLWWFGEESFAYLAAENNLDLEFIDFAEFYQKNYGYLSIRGIHDLEKYQVFDSDGNLLIKVKSYGNVSFRKFIERLRLNPFYQILRDRLKGRQRLKGSQGPVCCAILKRH